MKKSEEEIIQEAKNYLMKVKDLDRHDFFTVPVSNMKIFDVRLFDDFRYVLVTFKKSKWVDPEKNGCEYRWDFFRIEK